MRRLCALIVILVTVLSSTVFAYRWVDYQNNWYVLNEDSGEFLKGCLLDVGDNVFYLDNEGKLVTGWWRNPRSKKYYFFDNKSDRNYGGMLFGLHMIDGYLYYFGDDGSLQTSGEEGQYRNVYQEYYADIDGYLYYANTLMRDTSIAKSEFYTDTNYYTNVNLNNYYLATYGNVGHSKDLESLDKAEINTSRISQDSKNKVGTNTSGGTNYTVDEHGHITSFDAPTEISDLEKYGPRRMSQ